MFLKRNKQELYEKMDAFTGDESAQVHKIKVEKLLSGMYCQKEEANATDQFRFLEKHLGHDLLVTLIIYLSKSRENKIFSNKMPALQLSDEERKGQVPTDFASLFVVPPAAQQKTKSEKTNPVQTKFRKRYVAKMRRKERSQERGKHV